MTNSPSPYDDDKNALTVAAKTKVLNVDYKLAALLCYVPACAINLVSSIVFYKTEPVENKFLRFHAMQSLVLTGGYVAIGAVTGLASMILGPIPFIGFLVLPLLGVWWLVTVAFIGINIFAMVAAYKGSYFRLPYIGDIASRITESKL